MNRIWSLARQLRSYGRLTKIRFAIWRTLRPSLRSLFHGRDVAIVGGSPDLLGQCLGSLIDGHDLVVRLNLLSPVGRERDLGTRTDIRFIGSTLLDKHLPYAPLLTTTKRIITTKKNWAFMKNLNISCFYYPVETPFFSFNWLTDICQGKLKRIRYNRPPRSGIVFLSMLMKYGAPARITLYGFSMSVENAGQVIDYSGSGVSTYDLDRYLINHCDPAIEVNLLQQMKRLGKIGVGT